jgi:hypothetical protein
MENLFLILKTYVNKNELFLKFLYIIADTGESEIIHKKQTIFHHILIKKIKKMNFIDFNH